MANKQQEREQQQKAPEDTSRSSATQCHRQTVAEFSVRSPAIRMLVPGTHQLMVAPMTSMAMPYVITRLLVVASPTGVVGRPFSTRQDRGRPMRTLHWQVSTRPPLGYSRLM